MFRTALIAALCLAALPVSADDRITADNADHAELVCFPSSRDSQIFVDTDGPIVLRGLSETILLQALQSPLYKSRLISAVRPRCLARGSICVNGSVYQFLLAGREATKLELFQQTPGSAVTARLTAPRGRVTELSCEPNQLR